jgi:hypothetical protein
MVGNETILMEGGKECLRVAADQETHVVNPSTHSSIVHPSITMYVWSTCILRAAWLSREIIILIKVPTSAEINHLAVVQDE